MNRRALEEIGIARRFRVLGKATFAQRVRAIYDAANPPRPHPTLYEVFFVKRKICVVSGSGRRVGGPLEARSCPSKPWRRKMSLARPLSRPKPPEAVAEGQPLQGSSQRRRSAAEVGGPRLRPSLA